MKFALSGHDLLRLATAVEPIQPLQEAFLRIARDDQSVAAKGRNVTATGERQTSHGAAGQYRRVQRV